MADNNVVITVDVQGNATEKTQSLRAQMKALRDELGKLPEGTAEYNKVARQLGELTDKVGDLGKEVGTLAGDPLERLNNSFGMIGSSIMSLDFGAAQTGLKGMTAAVKDFKIKDAGEAAKGFGKTMFDLGKALMTNPIFLLGGIIAAVVTNFEELTKAGGLIGNVFGFIKDAIDNVIGGLVDFMDWIGLTDSKAAEREENQKKLDKEAEERRKKQEEQALKDAEHLHKEKERLAQEAARKEAERIQKIKNDQKSLTDFLLGENEKRYQNLLTGREKELRQLQLDYEQKKKLAHGDKELLVALDNEYNAQRLGVESKYFTASKEIKSASVQEDTKIKSDGLRSTIQFATDEELALEESANNQREIESSLYEHRNMLAQASLGALGSLADALTANGVLNAKQSFKVNKSLQLAQAGIGAVQAVQSVLADPTLVGPARFIAAAAVGITGAANVAKIAAMKFNPGTTTTPPPPGTMGGGGGGGSTPAPSLDLSFLNNGQTKAQPVQSYVLATNVTSAQDAQQKILDQSKLIK
jgi:hypothetical protein